MYVTLFDVFFYNFFFLFLFLAIVAVTVSSLVVVKESKRWWLADLGLKNLTKPK